MLALGLIEYKVIPTGIAACDAMLKGANVELIEAKTVCPGKFMIIIRGQLADVKACLEVGKAFKPSAVIDEMLLGNPASELFSAINGCGQILGSGALGILETYTAATAIESADLAVKTARVSLLEVRLARGMCGKSYCLFSGSIADVEMALNHAVKRANEKGFFVDAQTIANPSPALLANLC